LVWQVSVVNAGGFYLQVDGEGLPQEIFGDGSQPVNVTLLVEFGETPTVSNYANAVKLSTPLPEGSYIYVTTPDIPAWFPAAAPGSVPFIVKRAVPGSSGPVA